VERPLDDHAAPFPVERLEDDARLARYVDLILASPHNLVSRGARSELLTRHVPESLILASRLPAGPAQVVDIGSGAGLPGLVVALARPDLAVTLIEASAKKARFLEATAADLEVEVEVVAGRAEDVGRGALAGRFDHATARAVAPLDRLVPWALPLLRPGGLLHAVKGDRWAQDLASAARTIERLGARVVHTPDGSEAGQGVRVVIIAAPEPLPRRGRG